MTKIGMRNAWFQVHKWIGLILAILIIPLCADRRGAGVGRSARPRAQPAALRHQRQRDAGADRLCLAAQRARCAPAPRIATLERCPRRPAGRWSSRRRCPGRPRAAGRRRGTNVYLDPPTARVLDEANSHVGAAQVSSTCSTAALMVPGVGRSIVGWIGVAMLISSLYRAVAVVADGRAAWARGLRWRRHRNLDTNLHHLSASGSRCRCSCCR